MGTWTRTGREWTKGGSTSRTALIAGDPMPAAFEYTVDFLDPAHGLRVLLLTDRLGLTGYEAGFDTTGTGGNFFIRRVDYGTPQSNIVSVAHGLDTGATGRLIVRYVNRTIEIRRFVSATTSTVLLTTTLATTAPYLQNRAFGLVANVNGAKAIAPAYAPLRPVTRSRDDLLVAVCDGDVWIGTRTAIRKVATGVFRPVGRVSLIDYQQAVYGVDGQRARVIDVVAETVAPWELDEGSHLGQTDGIPDSTRATDVDTYNDRLVTFGDPVDPQNALLYEIGNPLSANTGANRSGRAWFLSGAAGRVGSPITCFKQTANGMAIIGCVDGAWRLIGDLDGGPVDLSPASLGTGVSGPSAAVLVENGLLVAHSPIGVYVFGPSGTPTPLSRPWISRTIQVPLDRLSEYVVSVQRDPFRGATHVFLTLAGGGDRAWWWWYNERTGQWSPSAGGFLPMRLPDRLGPTCTEYFLGKVVLGTRDGYLCWVNDAAVLDDGDPIPVRVCLSPIRPPELSADAVLHGMSFQTGRASAPWEVRVYGGETTEAAYERAASELRIVDTANPGTDDINRGTRAPVLLIEMAHQAASAATIEAVTANATWGKIQSWSTPYVPPPPALAPVDAALIDAPTYGPGVGDADDDGAYPEWLATGAGDGQIGGWWLTGGTE